LGAIEITTGRDIPEKIVERGQSPSGCPDSTSKRKERLSGKWLALTPTVVREAEPFVTANAVTSSKADERFYFTGVPLRVGEVQNATIKQMPTGTTARTEVEIRLGALRYRFIEWGAFSFALRTLAASGKNHSLEVHGAEGPSIPKEAYVATAEPRDGYDAGTLEVIRAGDFNADDVVDLLLRYQSKEAGGLVLWLSNPESRRHMEPVVSPTWYGDC
jgi:hypothetical protein